MKRFVAILLSAACLAVTSSPPASGRFALEGDQSAQSSTITLAFVGDIHFERHLVRNLEPGRMRSLASLWGGADLVVANLETAVTSAGVRQNKTYTFRAPARVVPALAAAGIGVVSLANNHAMDFGASGLRDTLRAFEGQSTAAVGVGADLASALAPYRQEVLDKDGTGSTPVSIFAVTSGEMLGAMDWAAREGRAGIAVWENHRKLLRAAIRAEVASNRVVVVFLHWGREQVNCPTPTQQRMAEDLESAGASVIVGAHPHVLQGIGFSQSGALIAYSLGNFIWYHGRSGPTGVLRVTLTDGKVTGVGFTPARITSTGLPERTRASLPVFGAYATCAGLSRGAG